MAQSDEIARLTRILLRDMAVTGRAKQLRLGAGLTCSELGKQAGVTGGQIGLAEDGRAPLSTAQTLAYLDYLLEAASWREAAGQEVAR